MCFLFISLVAQPTAPVTMDKVLFEYVSTEKQTTAEIVHIVTRIG